MDEYDIRLCRVELMAHPEQGRKWKLSDADRACLRAVLEDRYTQHAEAKEWKKRFLELQASQQGKGEEPKKTVDSSAEKARDLIESIEDILESGDIPYSGMEFAESVREGVAGIKRTINKRGYASKNQLTALENWADGLTKWIN